MNFTRALELLGRNEGGYTNDPKDRGNWTSGKVGQGELKGTKFGISAMTYPQIDIKNLTYDVAAKIYFHDFWLPMRCDELPKEVQFDAFDMAVNSGVKTAIKTLQKAVGVNVDGFFGQKTMAAIKAMNPEKLDKRLSAARLLFIAETKTWPTFGRGWVIRIANNLMAD